MPMHISPSIDTDLSRTETMLPRMGPIANSLSPATQCDILGILQREQDRAMALLSSSPLLASLFVSYANQAAALESASATPSPESKEWEALQNTVSTSQEEIEKLKSENIEMVEGLKAAKDSREAFRFQVSSLKEVNTTQENEIKSLRAEVIEAREKHDQLMVDSNAEKAALQIWVLDLEAQRGELKEAVVEQQIKISRLERQGFASSPDLSTVATPIRATRACGSSIHGSVNSDDASARNSKERAEREAREAQERAEREAMEQAEKEAKEKAEKEAMENMDKAARRKAEREAAKKADKDAREQAEREAREEAEQEAREKAEREEKRKVEREASEQEAREREEKKRAEREEKERIERDMDERQMIERQMMIEREMIEREEKEKAEQEEKENIERQEKEDAERETTEKANREAKEREEGEKKKAPVSGIPSAWGSTVGKNDRSSKTSSLSQKEQKSEWANTWDPGSTDKKDESSGFPLPPISTAPTSGGILNGASNFDFFTTGNKDSPVGAEEAELRTLLTKEGKKGIDSPSNPSKVAILEDLNLTDMSVRASISSENERFTEAEQGSSPAEPTPPSLEPEINLDAFLNTTSELLQAPKNVQKEASLWDRKKLKTASPPAPTSALFSGGDRSNSLGVWGGASGGGNAETIAMPALVGDRQSIFTDTARDQKEENRRENVVEGLLGSNPVRRRNNPALSQMNTKPIPRPALAGQNSSGWGSWGASLLTNIASAVAAPDRSPSPEPPRGTWGAAKTSPTSIARKEPTGPAWGSKPMGSTFGTGGAGWGGGTGSAFGSGVGENLAVDAATKPTESGPNVTGPEHIPEPAAEIELIMEETGESAKVEEAVTPTEEDEFDWVDQGRKKKSQIASAVQSQTPSAPNTPDDLGGGLGGGNRGGKKKKMRGKK